MFFLDATEDKSSEGLWFSRVLFGGGRHVQSTSQQVIPGREQRCGKARRQEVLFHLILRDACPLQAGGPF